MLFEALQTTGMSVDVAARLRSRVGDGNVLQQVRLAEMGTKLAGRLLRQYQSGFRARPDVWFTYHLYYKAPDWIGPIVANALDIPYVVAEASFAPKRATGPWAQSHLAVETALRQADAVFSLNRNDIECLRDVCSKASLHYLPPFTHVENWTVANRADIDPKRVQLVTMAMMRDGDKLRSYEMLADTLGELTRTGIANWHLTVLGDGPARARVEKLFAAKAIANDQLTFAGLCTPEQARAFFQKSDLFVWPAINEAFGMALLEAQSAGLPVLAGDVGGVSGIVANGETGWLAEGGNARAFRDQLANCLQRDVGVLRKFGDAGASNAKLHHSLASAADVLGSTLRTLVANKAIGLSQSRQGGA
jgi:glycosyltransferase involved in cell wall biosynthesis